MPAGENVSHGPEDEFLEYPAPGTTPEDEEVRRWQEVQHGIQQHNGLDILDEMADTQAQGLPPKYRGVERRHAVVENNGTHYMTDQGGFFVPAGNHAPGGQSTRERVSKPAPPAGRHRASEGGVEDKTNDEDWWTE